MEKNGCWPNEQCADKWSGVCYDRTALSVANPGCPASGPQEGRGLTGGEGGAGDNLALEGKEAFPLGLRAWTVVRAAGVSGA